MIGCSIYDQNDYYRLHFKAAWQAGWDEFENESSINPYKLGSGEYEAYNVGWADRAAEQK